MRLLAALRVLLVAVLVGLGLPAIATGKEMPTGEELQRAGLGGGPAGEEVVSLRTETSRSYRKADGGLQTRFSLAPVNYRDAEGKWRGIDPSLRRTAAGLETTAGPLRVRLPERADGGRVRLDRGGEWLSFGLRGARGVAAKVAGRQARFAEALPGVSVDYEAGAESVKESLVLGSASAPSSYTFDVAASDGLTAGLEENGEVVFRDDAGSRRFTMETPWMQDADGEISYDVKYEIERRDSGGWVVRVVADEAWLQDPDRAFPVVVDPTTYYGVAKLCEIASGTLSNTNNCTTAEMTVNVGRENGRVHRALVAFDQVELQAALDDQVVTTADLFFQWTTSTPADVTLDAHQVTKTWSPLATWLKYNTTWPWSRPGGDYQPEYDTRRTLLSSWAGGWTGLGVGRIVQGWADGSIANQGIAVKPQNEGINRMDTLDGIGLVVESRPRRGIEPQATFERVQPTADAKVQVNVANGNLVYAQQDARLPAGSDALAVERVFNSLGDLAAGTFGTGWSTNRGTETTLWQHWVDDSYILEGPGGLSGRFYKRSTGTYFAPAGWNATLVENGDDTVSITFNTSGERWDFDTSDPRKLTKVVKGSYEQTLTYTGNRVGEISDTQDNALTYGYDATSGRLTSLTNGSTTRQYDIDTNSRLAKFTDPSGQDTTYAYHGDGRLSEITHPGGTRIALTYDSTGRVTSVVEKPDTNTANNRTTTFAYSSPTSPCVGSDYGKTVVTYPSGQTRTYCYSRTNTVRIATPVTSTDVTDPVLTLSGKAWEDRSGWHRAGPLPIKAFASDAHSGVKTVETKIDNTVVDTNTQTCTAGGCTMQRQHDVDMAALAEGTHTARVTVTDQANRTTAREWTLQIDKTAPVVDLGGSVAAANGGTLEGSTNDLTVDATDTGGSGVKSIEVLVDGQRADLVEQPCAAGECTMEEQFTYTDVDLPEGEHAIEVVVSDLAGNTRSDELTLTVGEQGAGDPPVEAPNLAPAAATDNVAESAAFLYTGPDAIQVGVDAETIVPRTGAVVRGKVTNTAGAPLAGVRVSVHDRPEFGHMVTRTDGEVYLVVNGGGPLTLVYEKDGHSEVQRRIDVPWQEWTFAEDVSMTPLDDEVTSVALDGTGTDAVVHEASTETDADGSRTATLLFKPGTEAEMVLDGGTRQPIATGHVRATEYTVGSRGVAAMPGDIPPNVGYTYAAEFSVDEALAAGATTVEFSQPVINYTDNFLTLPVGTTVPVGYYDRESATWKASKNGRVIKIVGTSGGLADLDIDGEGQATQAELDEFGIDNVEREQLADLYTAGDELWRVEIDHFTPWDHNLATNYPDAPAPGLPPTDADGDGVPDDQEHVDDSCQSSGSVIECENQILGESIPLTGTGITLNYRSDRVAGAGELEIPVTPPASVPSGLTSVRASVTVAGQTYQQDFPAQPGQVLEFEWDGKDGFGRTLRGQHTANVKLDWTYGSTRYVSTSAFGNAPTGTATLGTRTTAPVTRSAEQSYKIGSPAVGRGLGTWTFSPHHSYDPVSGTLWFGDGERKSIAGSSTQGVISSFAGTNDSTGAPSTAEHDIQVDPWSLAFADDGTLYYADFGAVYAIAPDGAIRTVAGDGGTAPTDGIPADSAFFSRIDHVAVGPDGSVYFATADLLVYKVTPAGTLFLIAGDEPEPCGEDCQPTLTATTFSLTSQASMFTAADNGQQPAVGFALPVITDLAVDSAGNVLLATDPNESDAGDTIQRVTPIGTIENIAGGETDGNTGDGGPATNANIVAQGMAVGPDDSIYLAAYDRVRRIAPDNTITTFSAPGGGLPGFAGNVAVRRDGTAFTSWGGRVYRLGPDGVGEQYAGDGQFPGYYDDGRGDGGPALRGRFWTNDIEVGPDGALYLADRQDRRIRKIGAPYPTFSGSDITVASPDGEELFLFDRNGRHLQTRDAVTGAVLTAFAYDAQGRLTSITDGDGLATTVGYPGSGQVTITGPYGHTNSVTLDQDGRLTSAENEAGHEWSMTYTSQGLLASFEDPEGRQSSMTYDSRGRLTSDTNPANGTKTLTRTETAQGRSVEVSSAEGRDVDYRLERTSSGATRREVEVEGGAVAATETATDGSQSATTLGGTAVTKQLRPDPRFGMQAPLVESAGFVTPALNGLGTATGLSRTVEQGDPQDPYTVTEIRDTATRGTATSERVTDVIAQTQTATSPAGRTASYEFDDQRRPTRVTAPGRGDVEITRDAEGRIISTTQGSRTTTHTYDTRGRLATTTDPANRVTEYHYDIVDRLTSVDLPDGRTVAYAYNAAGEITSITPAGKPAHQLGRNVFGSLASHLPPVISGQAESTQMAYDDDGLLASVTRADGRVVQTTRDGQGRATRVDYQGGGIDLTYGTDGHLATAQTDAGQDLTVTRDGGIANRIAWTGTISGTVDAAYDAQMRVQSTKVNNTSQVTYGYDEDDLLTSAGDLTLSRTPATGEVASATVGNVTTTYDRDPTYGELAQLDASAAGSTAFKQTYTRDSLGRVASMQETVNGQQADYAYTYDQGGRLTAVTRDGQPWAAYTFDENSNRLSASAPGQAATATYDDQDRLLTHGAGTYANTAQGERATKTVGADVVDYDYNDLGQLTSVELADGRTVEYVWDAQGSRVGRKLDGVLTQRLVFLDALRPAAELDGAGNVATRYVYGGSRTTPDYMVRAGVTYRIVADHLGSVRLVINASTGAVVQRLAYDPYGRVVEDTQPGFQPFGFAGGLYDADAQLVHFGAREYDPETGRWLTRDPLLFDGGDTNLYGYVLADPINLTDPTGLFGLPSLQSVSDFAAGFGDAVSFGITKDIREVLGSNAAVNFCSGAYRSGGNTGVAYSMVLPGPKVPRWRPAATAAGTAAGTTAKVGDEVGEYLAKNAPRQVTPGTRMLEGVRKNDQGRVEPWKAYYDEHGRLVGRTDYNAGNMADGIPDTHYHRYEYGPGYGNGREVESHVPGEYVP